jgi:outer membrane protein assembly factor BamD (BamD/ComL family)
MEGIFAYTPDARAARPPRSMFLLVLVLAMCAVARIAAADEARIAALARAHYDAGEYYNAVTECMRQVDLYPGGKGAPDALLLMGQAYYRGGNYYSATLAMMNCYDAYRDREQGERALLYLAYMRLQTGSPYFATRTLQEYRHIYREGAYLELTALDLCYASALDYDGRGALKALDDYNASWPDGKYVQKAQELRALILDEINRPRKSLAVSVVGSLLMPGFGNFYTGNYLTGTFSLLCNAALIYLIYDAYRDDNRFRMAVFGIAEFSFYQYSVISAINNVYLYNSREPFYRTVRLSMQEHF